jgi:acyl-CoA thioesterase II
LHQPTNCYRSSVADRTERLLRLLDLQRMDGDVFRAPTPWDGPGRLFGGQVASQALRAATLTVDADRPPHSLHAYFIRPGRPGPPLVLEVERTRDGRSFTTRHVTAEQDGEPIFNLTASFHAAEEGDDWQLPAPAGVPGPGEIELTSPLQRFASLMPLDIRPVHPVPEGEWPVFHPMWIRTGGPLPDDPVLHRCVIAFMSDMGVVGSARAPASTLPKTFMGASLDHAVWFHRPARADEWLLFSVEPVTNSGARGLARGTFHTEDGVLVASIAQEALLRSTGNPPLPG